MGDRQGVIVCVTNQFSCERLIHQGAAYADDLDLRLTVVHIVGANANFFGNANDGDALDYLFNIAKQHGGQIRLLKSDDVFASILTCARDENAAMIILGQSPHKGASSLLWRLRQALPDVDVTESTLPA